MRRLLYLYQRVMPVLQRQNREGCYLKAILSHIVFIYTWCNILSFLKLKSQKSYKKHYPLIYDVIIRRGRANKSQFRLNSYKIDNTVSQEPFLQLLKIHYLVSYKVISYNIKTCRGTKKHSKYAFPRKIYTKTKKTTTIASTFMI